MQLWNCAKEVELMPYGSSSPIDCPWQRIHDNINVSMYNPAADLFLCMITEGGWLFVKILWNSILHWALASCEKKLQPTRRLQGKIMLLTLIGINIFFCDHSRARVTTDGRAKRINKSCSDVSSSALKGKNSFIRAVADVINIKHQWSAYCYR